MSTRTLKKILDQSSRLNAKLDTLISGQKSLKERIAKLEEVLGNKVLIKILRRYISFNKLFKIFVNYQNCLIIYMLYI